MPRTTTGYRLATLRVGSGAIGRMSALVPLWQAHSPEWAAAPGCLELACRAAGGRLDWPHEHTDVPITGRPEGPVDRDRAPLLCNDKFMPKPLLDRQLARSAFSQASCPSHAVNVRLELPVPDVRVVTSIASSRMVRIYFCPFRPASSALASRSGRPKKPSLPKCFRSSSPNTRSKLPIW